MKNKCKNKSLHFSKITPSCINKTFYKSNYSHILINLSIYLLKSLSI